jgi:hypothetical protein
VAGFSLVAKVRFWPKAASQSNAFLIIRTTAPGESCRSDAQFTRVEEVRVRAKIAINIDLVVPNQSDRHSMMR